MIPLVLSAGEQSGYSLAMIRHNEAAPRERKSTVRVGDKPHQGMD